MKKLCFLISIVSLSFISIQCSKDVDTDSTVEKDFKKLDVEQSFNYETEKEISISMSVENSKGNAYDQLLMFIYTASPENGGELLEYFGLNSKTKLNTSIRISSATDSVFIGSNYSGIAGIMVPVTENGISYTYVGAELQKSITLKSIAVADKGIYSGFDDNFDNWKTHNDNGAKALLHSTHELCPIPEGIKGPDDHFIWGFDTKGGVRAFEAPSKFHTNIYGKYLRYDYYIGNTEGVFPTVSKIADIRITDGKQVLSVDLTPTFPHRVNGGWQTLYIKLDETAVNGSGWRIANMWTYSTSKGTSTLGKTAATTKQIKDILNNVTGILLAPESQNGRYGVSGPEFICVDNIGVVTSLDDDGIQVQEPLPNMDRDDDGVVNSLDLFPDDPTKAFVSYYPSEFTKGTLSFEDLWPAEGDYDFNDLVMNYKYTYYKNSSNLITQIDIDLLLRAIGGSIPSGFGIATDLDPTQIKQVTSSLSSEKSDLKNVLAAGVEGDQTKATIIVFNNALNVLEHSGVGIGVNTSNSAPVVESVPIKLSIEVTSPITIEEIGYAPNNPFIFRTEKRGQEVHLPGLKPTDLADATLFGTIHDATDLNSNYYYKTENGLPWGLNVPVELAYPLEKEPIYDAYLLFTEWARSGGYIHNDWYLEKDGYRNSSKLFGIK